MLDDLKKWTGMPRRQEPLTKEMIIHLAKQQAEARADGNSHDSAIIDWYVVGLHTGYRGIEWLQEKSHGCLL